MTPPNRSRSAGFKHIRAARDQRGLNAREKAVLLVLATYADEPGHCWPAVSTIADGASMAVSTVRKHLRSLEQKGLVTCRFRTRRDGGNDTTVYQLRLEQPQPPVQTAVASEEAGANSDSEILSLLKESLVKGPSGPGISAIATRYAAAFDKASEYADALEEVGSSEELREACDQLLAQAVDELELALTDSEVESLCRNARSRGPNGHNVFTQAACSVAAKEAKTPGSVRSPVRLITWKTKNLTKEPTK